MAGVLVTGAAGMVGSHLIEHLQAAGGGELVATYYRPTIRFSDIADRFALLELDVRHAEPVRRLIAAKRPQVIYHLAAQSLPTASWDDPWGTMEVNVTGTINVFEAVRSVRAHAPDYDPTVVVACSSAEYGASLTPERVPIDEDAPLLPLHPYGVSKVAQDLLAFQYWRNFGVRCIRARIFNCTGARKRADVVSDFARRIARAQGGKLRVGNLEAKRAIMDVRDLVTALVALAERGAPGEAYNICADRAVPIGELVELFGELAGVALTPVPDPALMRPSDEPVILGSTARLHAATGWRPLVPLRDTLRAVLDYEMAAR